MIFLLIIITLLIIFVTFCCTSKFSVDNFSMDYTCEAVQNKYYHPEELMYKSQCPNLVIVEKIMYNRPYFTVEAGDHRGPYFSSDYTTYYHMGVSPNGRLLNLEYDLYQRPWYNPYSWFHGRYYYEPRRNYHWRDKWYKPWNRYKNKIDRKDRKDRKFRNYYENSYEHKERNNRKHSDNRTPKRDTPKRDTPKRMQATKGNSKKVSTFGASASLM